MATPAENDSAWRHELRATVDALDALERPFTDFDRLRWGETSRIRHIERVRERYPAAFAATVKTTFEEASESMVRATS